MKVSAQASRAVSGCNDVTFAFGRRRRLRVQASNVKHAYKAEHGLKYDSSEPHVTEAGEFIPYISFANVRFDAVQAAANTGDVCGHCIRKQLMEPGI